MRKAGVYDAIKDRLVLGENISQAAQFVESGKRGRGNPRAFSGPFAGAKRKRPLLARSENLYAPIEQGVVLVRASQNPQGAQAFLDYIKTPATAALLERYGFVMPGKGKP